jgi:hypothetical protein
VGDATIAITFGVATIAITFGVYGHLMRGGRVEARVRIESCLERLDGRPRLHAVGE